MTLPQFGEHQNPYFAEAIADRRAGKRHDRTYLFYGIFALDPDWWRARFATIEVKYRHGALRWFEDATMLPREEVAKRLRAAIEERWSYKPTAIEVRRQAADPNGVCCLLREKRT